MRKNLQCSLAQRQQQPGWRNTHMVCWYGIENTRAIGRSDKQTYTQEAGRETKQHNGSWSMSKQENRCRQGNKERDVSAARSLLCPSVCLSVCRMKNLSIQRIDRQHTDRSRTVTRPSTAHPTHTLHTTAAGAHKNPKITSLGWARSHVAVEGVSCVAHVGEHRLERPAHGRRAGQHQLHILTRRPQVGRHNLMKDERKDTGTHKGVLMALLCVCACVV